MSLTTKIQVKVIADLLKTLDLGNASAPLNQTYAVDLTSGTGAGMADKVFHDTRSIAASSSENLDLAGGLTDALGDACTFARVKAIAIVAAATNVNNVIVGGDVTNTFFPMFGAETDTLVLRPGAGVILWAGAADATGYLVTASTADLLKIANSSSGSSVSYDVIIIGASA